MFKTNKRIRRVYRVTAELAGAWPSIFAGTEFSVELGSGWAQKASGFSGYHWGDVALHKDRVAMGAEHLEQRQAIKYSLCAAGDYVIVAFRQRALPLADRVGEMLIAQGAVLVMEDVGCKGPETRTVFDT
jgi:hypothetical protein